MTKPKNKKCINPACGVVNYNTEFDHCNICKTKFSRPVGRPRTCVAIDHNLLRKLRKEKGLRQVDIARLIGCSHGRVGQFEIGYKYGVPMDLLKHIAIILEVDYRDLMVEE